MANVVKFKGHNKILKPYPGSEGFVQDLPIFTNGKACVSCWEFTKNEYIQFIRDHQNGVKLRVFVSVLAAGQPPIYIGTEDSVRAMVSDFGAVWKK